MKQLLCLFSMAVAVTSVGIAADALSPAREILKAYDLNKDGALDESELAVYLTEKNKEFDLNHDGTVTSEELVDYHSPTNRARKLVHERNLDQPLDAAALQKELKLPPPDDKSFLALASDWVQLRKSFMTPDDKAKDPAKLSWAVARHDSSYTFDGALSLAEKAGYVPLDWTPSLLGTVYLINARVQPTIEAHVSNVKSDSPDSLQFGVPVRFLGSLTEQDLTSTNPPWMTGFQLSLTPVYETDSRFDVETFMVNPAFSPTMPKFAMGSDWAITDNIFFRWRPYLGAELGRVLDDGNIADLQETKTITRLMAKFSGELQFWENFLITGQFVIRRQLDSDDHTFLYGDVSPQFTLDAAKHFAVGVTLKSGKQPPKFEDEHSANIWIGLKF